MAKKPNKRQSKKNQKTQFIREVKTVTSFSEKEIKQVLRDKEKRVQLEKELQAKKRAEEERTRKEIENEIARRRSAQIRSYGFKSSEKPFHSMTRWKSEEKFQQKLAELVKDKQKEEEKQNKARNKKSNSMKLAIFWKDKLDEGLDYEEEYRELYLETDGLDNDMLFKMIDEIIELKIGGTPIATENCYLSNDSNIKSLKMFNSSNNWLLFYYGNTRQKNSFLRSIYTILQMTYEPAEKQNFIGVLVYQFLPKVNEKLAEEFRHELKMF